MRRFIRAALGGLAGCALVLGGTQSAVGSSLLKQLFAGDLLDLDTNGPALPYETTGAFDSADAYLKVTEESDSTDESGSTTFLIRVKGIDPAFSGRKFGSHLHTASCVTNSPDLTGGHYKHSGLSFPSNEVWFELVPNDEGVAVDRVVVPFVPKDDEGIMSIVIHENPTNPTNGSAGNKEVCLPLVTTWGPKVEPPPVIETP